MSLHNITISDKKGESLLVDEIQVMERGEHNRTITSEDQYGQISNTSAGIEGGEGKRGGTGSADNSDEGEAEWREGVEMDEGMWAPSDEDDDEWSQEGMVDDKGEDSDNSGSKHSDKLGDKVEEDCSTLGSGERKRNRSALEGKLQGAKVSGSTIARTHRPCMHAHTRDHTKLLTSIQCNLSIMQATAKKKRRRKKFSRNFISSREKQLNF